jgi:hypothetical protein
MRASKQSIWWIGRNSSLFNIRYRYRTKARRKKDHIKNKKQIERNDSLFNTVYIDINLPWLIHRLIHKDKL